MVHMFGTWFGQLADVVLYQKCNHQRIGSIFLFLNSGMDLDINFANAGLYHLFYRSTACCFSFSDQIMHKL